MRKPPLPPIEEPAETNVGLEIRILGNLSMRLMDKYSHKDKINDATGYNGWILRFLAEAEEEGRDIYQRDIEKKFFITRSTVSKVLTLMEQKGLIERQNVRGDARLRRIVMTEKARELHRLMHSDWFVFVEIISRGLSEEELETFYTLTAKMKANLMEALEN